MTEHLPALQVVVPLIAAPLTVLLRRPLAAWALSVAVCAFSLYTAIRLALQVLAQGPLSYDMGGWAPPWGIEYRIDMANAAVLVLVSLIGTVVAVYARRSVNAEIGHDRRHLFYTAYLLCFTGLLGMAATGDAFNLFVFLEISSLSTYALISIGYDRRALTASYQYLIMGTVGATFLLIGIGFLYVMTGTLNMQDLAQRLPAVMDTRTVKVAFAFIVVGLSLKLALFPLHLWLPNAYAFAPSSVSAFVAATSTKVAIYVLLRFLLTIFGFQFSFEHMPIGNILLVLSVAAMLSASVVAIFQQNVKRLLAYSSVAQVGYITLGISLGTSAGVAAGYLHLLNHALIKGALFLAVGCLFYRINSARLSDLRGAGRSMPWTAAAFVIGGLSLIGMPLTSGFISKWKLVEAALAIGWWPIAVLILATSLLAVIYVWRVVETLYFQSAEEGTAAVSEAPLGLLIPAWGLALANIYFGVDATVTWGLAHGAARALMGGVP